MPRSPRDSSAYAEALTTGTATNRFKIDYKLFNYILDDIKSNTLPYGSVRVQPSGDEMSERAARLQTHVIFRDASSFFDWIGIAEDMDRKVILIENRKDGKEGGVQAICIIGSMCRDIADTASPIQLHIGRSSCGTISSTAHDQGESTFGSVLVDCITYASGRWDVENSMFLQGPVVTTGDTGDCGEHCIDSTFAISGKALPPLSRRRYSVTPHF